MTVETKVGPNGKKRRGRHQMGRGGIAAWNWRGGLFPGGNRKKSLETKKKRRKNALMRFSTRLGIEEKE